MSKTATAVTQTRLSELIESRGLRHLFLAEKLGLSRSAFSRLVTGRRAIRRAEAIVLADLLGVDEEALQSGSPVAKEEQAGGVFDG